MFSLFLASWVPIFKSTSTLTYIYTFMWKLTQPGFPSGWYAPNLAQTGHSEGSLNDIDPQNAPGKNRKEGQIWGRMSQEVRINGLLHLHTPFITFDPNFQRDIQVGGFLKFPNHLPLISENHRKNIFPLPKLKQRDFASRLFFADAWENEFFGLRMASFWRFIRIGGGSHLWLFSLLPKYGLIWLFCLDSSGGEKTSFIERRWNCTRMLYSNS